MRNRPGSCASRFNGMKPGDARLGRDPRLVIELATHLAAFSTTAAVEPEQ